MERQSERERKREALVTQSIIASEQFLIPKFERFIIQTNTHAMVCACACDCVCNANGEDNIKCGEQHMHNRHGKRYSKLKHA